MNRAITIAAAGLFAVILVIAAGITAITSSSSTGQPPSHHALADIPPDYLRTYTHAAVVECPGLSWTILAAIGKIESNHGRSHLPGVRSGANRAGAMGPMQFLQATFNTYAQPVPPGGADPPTPYHPVNAIHAAARYLCASGAPDDLRAAIFAYNRAQWYVAKVLAQASQYGSPAGPGTGHPPSAAAATAIDYAMAQLGLPYVWGGDGPDAGDGGFDCSGLVKAAYQAAGIRLPRTAHTQYHATARVSEAELQPGDLVFYGPADIEIHHVGLYIGGGQMIDAPTFGQPVGIHPIRYPGDDFAGGGRVLSGGHLSVRDRPAALCRSVPGWVASGSRKVTVWSRCR